MSLSVEGLETGEEARMGSARRRWIDTLTRRRRDRGIMGNDLFSKTRTGVLFFS
jgi:hypothetical protein